MEQENLIQKDSFIDYLKETPNFLSVFIFSVFFNIASLMLIDMGNSTGIRTTDLSLIFTFYTIGAVAGQLTSVLYNRKFSKIQVIIAGYILSIPLIVIAVFNPNIYLFYVIYLVSGYLLGVIWIQANELILESRIKNKDRLITILLTFYPIGALVSPLIASSIIKSGLSWRFSYYVIIFLIVVNIGLYILLLGRKKGSLASSKTEKVGLKEIFLNRTSNLIFLLVLIALILYCCSETVIATWAPTFFRLERGLDIQSAGFALTIFWIFIVIGRIVALILAGKVKSTKMMIVLSCIAMVAATVLVFVKKEYMIYVITAVAGLGYSALFPLLISTGSTLYKKGQGVLATFLFVGANIGLSSAPFLTKYLANISMMLSLGIAAIIMAIVFLVLIAVNALYFKRAAQEN